ncbi:MAG TPA: hypothetical protein ENI42_04335 [Thermoplasmatales archaeon]|nr:hypothetical protein [Thermoplasmatales archaeon]
MKIQVKTLPENTIKEYSIQKSSTIEKLFKQMKLKPDAVIALRNNQPIPLTETLQENEEITIIKIASGG